MTPKRYSLFLLMVVGQLLSCHPNTPIHVVNQPITTLAPPFIAALEKTPPSPDIDYFPSMTIKVQIGITQESEAKKAFDNFIISNNLGIRQDWSPLRQSNLYYYLEHRTIFDSYIYARIGGTSIKLYTPR